MTPVHWLLEVKRCRRRRGLALHLHPLKRLSRLFMTEGFGLCCELLWFLLNQGSYSHMKRDECQDTLRAEVKLDRPSVLLYKHVPWCECKPEQHFLLQSHVQNPIQCPARTDLIHMAEIVNSHSKWRKKTYLQYWHITCASIRRDSISAGHMSVTLFKCRLYRFRFFSHHFQTVPGNHWFPLIFTWSIRRLVKRVWVIRHNEDEDLH